MKFNRANYFSPIEMFVGGDGFVHSRTAPIDSVLLPDQISGNYNYKMGVSRIKKIGETKYKKEFTHISFAPRNVV